MNDGMCHLGEICHLDHSLSSSSPPRSEDPNRGTRGNPDTSDKPLARFSCVCHHFVSSHHPRGKSSNMNFSSYPRFLSPNCESFLIFWNSGLHPGSYRITRSKLHWSHWQIGEQTLLENCSQGVSELFFIALMVTITGWERAIFHLPRGETGIITR